jgi:hypothetical protein
VFDWAEDVLPPWMRQSTKRGHYLDQTAEMREARHNTATCGYCGKQEPAAKGYTFCPHCIGSEYLKASELYLTRMHLVDIAEDRASLTEAERAQLLPLYKEAQLHGHTARDKARIAKERADIQREYEAAIRKATTKRDGLTWLMDRGIRTDNVIYYDHTETWCFGWRTPIGQDLIGDLHANLEGFPFKTEFKTEK